MRIILLIFTLISTSIQAQVFSLNELKEIVFMDAKESNNYLINEKDFSFGTVSNGLTIYKNGNDYMSIRRNENGFSFLTTIQKYQSLLDKIEYDYLIHQVYTEISDEGGVLTIYHESNLSISTVVGPGNIFSISISERK